MEIPNDKNKEEKLRLKIKESNLSQEDKDFWDSVLSSFPADLTSGIYDTLTQFPAELSWLTQIYQRKQKAFGILKSNKLEGQKLLGEIYEEERKKLEQLTAN